MSTYGVREMANAVNNFKKYFSESRTGKYKKEYLIKSIESSLKAISFFAEYSTGYTIPIPAMLMGREVGNYMYDVIKGDETFPIKTAPVDKAEDTMSDITTEYLNTINTITNLKESWSEADKKKRYGK